MHYAVAYVGQAEHDCRAMAEQAGWAIAGAGVQGRRPPYHKAPTTVVLRTCGPCPQKPASRKMRRALVQIQLEGRVRRRRHRPAAGGNRWWRGAGWGAHRRPGGIRMHDRGLRWRRVSVQSPGRNQMADARLCGSCHHDGHDLGGARHDRDDKRRGGPARTWRR